MHIISTDSTIKNYIYNGNKTDSHTVLFGCIQIWMHVKIDQGGERTV